MGEASRIVSVEQFERTALGSVTILGPSRVQVGSVTACSVSVFGSVDALSPAYNVETCLIRLKIWAMMK